MSLIWTNSNGLPSLTLSHFVGQLTQCLPALLDFLLSDELRRHPVWGKLLPFDTQAYGVGRSLGHCIRPDIIITPDGPRICEFDFVASGRGFALSALHESDPRRHTYLKKWSEWYRAMNRRHVQYATATRTTCWAETVLFSEALQKETGIEIEAVNIDEPPVNGALIDRLFYRSEMLHPEHTQGREIITMEPHLDSKMLFALIHDPDMELMLANAIGVDALLFLREVCPLTFSLDCLRERRPVFLEHIATRRSDWIIKNADVEVDCCWGSRGVIMGRKLGASAFRQALFQGKNPGSKEMGSRPVVQQFAPSLDFAPIWDTIVRGELSSSDAMGRDFEEVTTEPARKHVFARVGVFLLVSNVDRSVCVPPVGVLTLRQDELAHGSRDALSSAIVIA